jgi:hypothetical protein
MFEVRGFNELTTVGVEVRKNLVEVGERQQLVISEVISWIWICGASNK